MELFAEKVNAIGLIGKREADVRSDRVRQRVWKIDVTLHGIAYWTFATVVGVVSTYVTVFRVFSI